MPLRQQLLRPNVAADVADRAQQPVRPLSKVGGCPLGWLSSGSYCVKSR